MIDSSIKTNLSKLYRTSTSSCSNQSYLNSSVISNQNKGTAYADVLLNWIPTGVKNSKREFMDKSSRIAFNKAIGSILSNRGGK